MEKILLKSKKILIFSFLTILFYLLIKTHVYAYNESWYFHEDKLSGNMNGNAKVVTSYAGNALTPAINSIKFRQDNNYYYFDYNLEYKNTTLKLADYESASAGSNSIFVSSLKNTWPSFEHNWSFLYHNSVSCTNYEKTNGTVTFGTKKFEYELYNKHVKYLGEIISDGYDPDNEGTIINTPISGLPNNYYFATPKQLHNLYKDRTNKSLTPIKKGTATVSVKATKMSDSYWHYKYIGTVKIAKTEIDTYRYLSLLATNAVTSSEIDTSAGVYTSGNVDRGDIRGSSIDLKSYCTCNHEWQYINICDKTCHEKKCNKCAWNVKENHLLEFQYDDIENNTCACGYNDKVRCVYIINDDEKEEVSMIVPSFSDTPSISANKKTGYKFLWYEYYEKQKESGSSLVETFISTRSEIAKKTENCSVKYIAIYRPNTYKIHFSNINNLGITVLGHLEDQLFTYDEEKEIRDGIVCEGYTFEGWTFTCGGFDVDIEPHKLIKNQTELDNDIIVLYPVYNEIEVEVNDDEIDTNDSDEDENIEKTSGNKSGNGENLSNENASNDKDSKDNASNDNESKDNENNILKSINFTTKQSSNGNNGGSSNVSSNGIYGTQMQNEINYDGNINEELAQNNSIYNKDINVRENLNNDKTDESINKNVVSENYNNLLRFLREKYEIDKLRKEQEKTSREKNNIQKISVDIDGVYLKSQLLTTFLYRYKLALVIVTVAIVVGACLFLPGKKE